MTDYRYQLETRRVTHRRQQKFTCPQCGGRKCFVRYVDTHHQYRYVADEVGKCDHEHSCGYHYKPGEYYRDHPSERDRQEPSRREPVVIEPPQPSVLIPLPAELVSRSQSPQSTFWQWMRNEAAPHLGIGEGDLQRVYSDYFIGATRQSDIVFWQIDEQLRVHTGHIMCYGSDGHRLAPQSWTHFRLQQRGELPLDYQPPKCLFGLHLLHHYRQLPVAIVESEKTALLMAATRPDLLWLATAGCGGLSSEKLEALHNRRLLLFPNSGCYDKWNRQMQHTQGLDYAISRHLEQYPPNTDLADLLLRTGHAPD